MYLNSLGFVLSRPRFMRAYARVRREIRTIRPIDDLETLESELLARELRTTPERARQRIVREVYGTWETTLDRVKPYPHVRECVSGIRDRGLRVAVSSDFPVQGKLKRLGLDDLFDCELWTEDSGYLKPHPEPFVMLAGCIGCEPGEILYVGNSYEYDVVGATSAGMRAAHLARRPVANTLAEFTFSDYRDLCHYVTHHG
jgi:putative hydrolase of the HAD superfamily